MPILVDRQKFPLLASTIARDCGKGKSQSGIYHRGHRVHRVGSGARTPHPGGNADGYQNKGVAGKAICKTMKTKGRQKKANDNAKSGDVAEVPHTPGVLLKESASC